MMKRAQKAKFFFLRDPRGRREEDPLNTISEGPPVEVLDQPTIPSGGFQVEVEKGVNKGKRRRSSDQRSSEVQNKRKHFGPKSSNDQTNGHQKRKRDEQRSSPSSGEERPAKMGRFGSLLMRANKLLHNVYYSLFPTKKSRSSSSPPPNTTKKTAEDDRVVIEAVNEVVSEQVGGIVSEVSNENISNGDVAGEVISEASPCVSTGYDAPADFNLSSFIYHKILGRGSFGTVALASHVATGRKVAVKVVKKSKLLQLEPSTVLSECNVLQKVSMSPFCTRAFGSFQTEDDLFFVMEYYGGGDLHSALCRGAPFSTDVVRFIAAELLCGIQFLHSLGIVHRDLKPQNILLDSSGHIKIGDFGLCQENIFGSQMAYGNAGTRGYKAPEVELYKSFTATADYYSFGIILFEMATGKDCRYVNFRQSYYPRGFDLDLQDVIERLLLVCPQRRSIAVERLREHPFFRPINWKELETGNATSPLIQPVPEIDTRHQMDMKNLINTDKSGGLYSSEQGDFHGFSFKCNAW